MSEIIRKNLISASDVLSNFEELNKFKVKDIINENGELDEENIEQNQAALEQLTES